MYGLGRMGTNPESAVDGPTSYLLAGESPDSGDPCQDSIVTLAG